MANSRRAVGVVTGSRSEYGLLRPLLRLLAKDKRIEAGVYVTGAHLRPEFGWTWREVAADGFPVWARVPILDKGPLGPRKVAQALARAVDGFSAAFERRRPDLLVVLGDRYETLGAASAALPHRVPVAHISGGKTTEGAIDEQVRHAVTKLSHYHFTHNEAFRRRLLRMGERPDRVFATGSPLVDEILSLPKRSKAETLKRCGLPPLAHYLVVVYHPETLSSDKPGQQVAEVLRGAAESGLPLVLFYPGADAGSAEIVAELKTFSATYGAPLVRSLPREDFLSVVRHSEAIVGNSSAGVTDAPSLGVPTVNAGGRQDGMLKAKSVIDCAPTAESVADSLARALKPGFREAAAGLSNPYGDGHACPRIAEALATLPLGPDILRKPFNDGGA